MIRALRKPVDAIELRKFGFTVGGVFAVVFGLLVPLVSSHPFRVWPWAIAVGLIAPALIWPRSLSLVYRLWMAVGEVLGAINSRIILSAVFFVVLVPIALLRRLFSGNPLALKWDLKAVSYRVKAPERDISKLMERPFL